MPVIKSAALVRVEGYTPEDPVIEVIDGLIFFSAQLFSKYVNKYMHSMYKCIM